MTAPRRAALLAALLAPLVTGCGEEHTAPPPQAAPAAQDSPAASPGGPPPLVVRGTRFEADGRPFDWRGLTAFALLEQLARGGEAEVAALLDWASARRVTVVRVLAMAHHLFQLSPEDGRASLPRLLEMAAARGLYIEIVALADTKEIPVDLRAHVREVGAIAARHANAVVEIANEPAHPTQRAEVHDAATLEALAALVPNNVPVALGSAEYGDAFAGGDYATYHFPRDEGWGHVLRLAEGAALVERWQKPVVNDEPIGAGPDYDPGRRDNAPARFTAAALLTRLAGMYGTFHYEGGLLARLPQGIEATLFDAWMRGLELGSDVPAGEGEFLAGDDTASVVLARGAAGVFARVSSGSAWILLVNPGEDAAVDWVPPWRETERADVPGVRLLRGRRSD